MLYLFRKVYSEVVTAIPVNGGTYNLMLNTVSKKIAGFVAALSFLSYTATAIVSAFDAVVYLAEIWSDCSAYIQFPILKLCFLSYIFCIDIRLITVLILLLFGVVTICGVKESSFVTCSMFTIHMVTLTLLIVWGFAHGIQDNFSLFSANLHTPVPTIHSTSGTLLGHRNPAAAIFFGYSSGLLGITGFETVSNYVEELESAEVFISTVNWMW
jgi:amino acid transporter